MLANNWQNPESNGPLTNRPRPRIQTPRNGKPKPSSHGTSYTCRLLAPLEFAQLPLKPTALTIQVDLLLRWPAEVRKRGRYNSDYEKDADPESQAGSRYLLLLPFFLCGLRVLLSCFLASLLLC